MSDIHALSGAYAVDALDEFERVAFERHLAHCTHCRSEVDGLREASALFAEMTAQEPPAALRDRVLAEVATVRPLPPVLAAVPVPTLTRHRSTVRRAATALVAAAAVVALAGGATVVWQSRDDSATTTQLSAAERVQQAPDAKVFSQDASGGGTITLVVSKSLNKAVVKTTGLASPPAGHTHEFWLQHNNVMIPAGFSERGGDSEVVLTGDAASAERFGITIEPETGSTSPSDKIVSLIDLSDA